MLITKKQLPRRTFLKGMGATIALPMLDAMTPALGAFGRAAAKAPLRLGFAYVPNGITMADCQRFLAPFNDAARQTIVACYFDANGPQGSSCGDKFENECVFPPGP